MVRKLGSRRLGFRKKRLFKRRNLKKTRFSSKNQVVRYNPRGENRILPPEYNARLETQLYGKIAAGGAGGDYSWSFAFNNCYQPWNYANTGLVVDPNFASATLNPVNFATLCNVNVYQKYKVYASAIDIQLIPSDPSDVMICSVCPLHTALGVPAQPMINQRFTRRMVFSSNKGLMSSLKHYMPIHTLIGQPRSSIDNDISGQYVGSYNAKSTTQHLWNVAIETMSNNALVDVCFVIIKLTYYVSFQGMNEATAPVN